MFNKFVKSNIDFFKSDFANKTPQLTLSILNRPNSITMEYE
jgi:hypothetical protein